jgi:hypothetical protein
MASQMMQPKAKQCEEGQKNSKPVLKSKNELK